MTSARIGRLRYAVRMTWNGEPKNIAARLRLLYRDFITHGLFGPDGERCQDCGRGYPLWRVSDDLYLEVIGNNGGLLCLGCFDERASDKGICLLWTPKLWKRPE